MQSAPRTPIPLGFGDGFTAHRPPRPPLLAERKMHEPIDSEQKLDELMTRPGDALCEFVKTLGERVVVLGAGGKVGPSLAARLKRAANKAGHPLEVVAVSRFSNAPLRSWLEEREVTAIPCDLLDRESLSRLPDAKHIIYLVGLKFGTSQNPALTWAINTLVPTHATERYPNSRFVALSTGNVYPLSPADGGGSVETDALTPIGEYANAAIARERLFEYHALRLGTPLVLLRLNYAVDLRYGVLLEIAKTVWAERPVDLTTGHLNCIWQGDANDLILRSLELATSPPAVFNLTGSTVLSVANIARRFAVLMNRKVAFTGEEASTALLSNSAALCAKLGKPATPLDSVLQWTADWVMRGGETYGKPTHFQVRDGKY